MTITNVPVTFPNEAADSVTINAANPRVVRLDFTGMVGTFDGPVNVILKSSTMIQASGSVTYSLILGGTTLATVTGWGSTSTVGIQKTFVISAAAMQPYIGTTVDLNFTSSAATNAGVGTDKNVNANRKPEASVDLTAPVSIPANYNAQLMTATGLAGNAIGKGSKPKTVAAQLMTATATANNPTVIGYDGIETLFSDDANRRSNGGVTDIGRLTIPILRDGVNSDQYIAKIDFSNVSNRNVISAYLRVYVTSGGTGSINIYDASNSWSDAAGNAGLISVPTTPISTANITAVTDKWINIPLDAAWVKANSGVHSLLITGNNPTQFTIASLDTATKPSLVYVLEHVGPTSVTVNPVVATGTAQLIEPSVGTETHISVSVNAETGLASGSMPMPVVAGTTEPDVTFTAQPMTAIGQAIDSTVVAGNSVTIIVNDQGEATGQMLDSTFSSDTPVNFNAQSMISIGRIITPKVNGFDIGYYDDPYYVQTQAQTDADDVWYRFTEETGAQIVKDEKTDFYGLLAADGIVFGGPTIGPGVPNHRSMFFDGLDDYIEVPVTADGATNTRDGFFQGSTEFYIKTEGRNQPIMISHGDLNMGQSSFTGLNRDSEISIVDGRIRLTNLITKQANPVKDVITLDGIKDIADGQWHQVVITNEWYGLVGSQQAGTSIYIDGKLDRRRGVTNANNGAQLIVGRPDTIGRSGNTYFRGELSEIVHRTFSNYSKYLIEQAYYAFFSFNPIRPELMTAKAEMGNAKGRGNAIKILALHHRFSPRLGGTAGPSGLDSTGLDTQWADQNQSVVSSGLANFTLAKYGNIYPPYAGTNQDINSSISVLPGAKMHFQSIFYKKTDIGIDTTWRDNVTDEARAIDLANDIDLDDFDAIYMVDWPGVDYFKNTMQFRNHLQVYEQFLEGLRVATFDKGVELYLPSPDAAKALGLVDDFESKLVHWDSLPAQSGYSASWANGLVEKTDFVSAYNSPFTNPEALAGRESAERERIARDVSTPRNEGSMMNFYDTHRNNHHRIAAGIPEFSDIGGYVLVETMWHRQDLSDYKLGPSLSYRYLDRNNGLQIGDEVMISGPLGVDEAYASDGNPAQTKYRLISFRPDQINVGIAAAKESLWLDDGITRLANPSAENATIILIPAGSELDGRVINGRIVIAPNDNAAYTEENKVTYFQDLNDTTWENAFKFENAISKAWQYSTHRLTKGKIEIESTSNTVISGKDGSNAVLTNTTKRSQMVAGYSKTIPVRQVEMPERLWNWLLQPADAVEEGEVKFRANALSGTASMLQAQVGAVSNKTVNATTMLANATMIRPLEDTQGENVINVFPMTARGEMISPEKKIVVEAMTARAEMIDAVGFDYDAEDILFLKVQNVKEITLTRNGEL